MKPYFIKTSSLLKIIFNKWVWSFSKKEKTLYLTFDDGPTPEITDWTLEQLEHFNAKATFFCIGKNIVKNPTIYQKIVDQNHSIGNHTNNHFNSFKTSKKQYLNNITKAEGEIYNESSTAAKLFRPPYGKLKISTSKEIRKKGYKIIMWDVLSADFDTSISTEDCLQNVIKNTENGSVIVFHDSVKASKNLKYTLPKVLEYYSNKGYTFKSIN